MNRLDRAAAGARAADRVIARMDARESRYECIICGVERLHCKHGKCWTCEGCCQCDTFNNDEAPTEAERAVDKVLAKHLVEFMRLQQAANGIAVKPHDCFENLSAQLVCSLCGAAWVEQKIGGKR